MCCTGKKTPECFVMSLTQSFHGLAKVPKMVVLDAITITMTLYAHGSRSDITEDGIQSTTTRHKLVTMFYQVLSMVDKFVNGAEGYDMHGRPDPDVVRFAASHRTA